MHDEPFGKLIEEHYIFKADVIVDVSN